MLWSSSSLIQVWIFKPLLFLNHCSCSRIRWNTGVFTSRHVNSGIWGWNKALLWLLCVAACRFSIHFSFSSSQQSVRAFEVRMPELPPRKHLRHMTLLLYVMKIIPLVSAAELKVAASAHGILQDSKALMKIWPLVNLDTKDFACKWRSGLSIIWAVSQFHSLPAAAGSFIWASLTAVGFKDQVQAISHCLSLYLCSNLGKYKSGADANLGLFN